MLTVNSQTLYMYLSNFILHILTKYFRQMGLQLSSDLVVLWYTTNDDKS